jgi:hypothetical protein
MRWVSVGESLSTGWLNFFMIISWLLCGIVFTNLLKYCKVRLTSVGEKKKVFNRKRLCVSKTKLITWGETGEWVYNYFLKRFSKVFYIQKENRRAKERKRNTWKFEFVQVLISHNNKC